MGEAQRHEGPCGIAARPLVSVHTEPFRLGMATFDYGIVVRWRGRYRAFGRRDLSFADQVERWLHNIQKEVQF
jgi:hypothetical protein